MIYRQSSIIKLLRFRTSAKKDEKGFTIIELMIATSVFGFILLIASVAVISIGRIYHKALISSQTQEVARRITEDIGSSLQFSNNNISRDDTNGDLGLRSICFGQDRYTYQINSKVPGGAGLVRDLRPDQSSCDPLTSGGEQMLSNNMRLLQLDISNSNPHSIKVAVAQGDNDLLDIYPINASASASPSNTNLSFIADAHCRSSIFGGTFCAVSKLETVVTNRVE